MRSALYRIVPLHIFLEQKSDPPVNRTAALFLLSVMSYRLPIQ